MEVSNKLLLGIILTFIVGSFFSVQYAFLDATQLENITITTNVTGSVSGDFYFDVASGKVDGYSSINKFGHNPSTTSGDDVWSGGGVYDFFPTSAQAIDVHSTDNDDAVGDTGARTLLVYGLNESWHEVSEYVNLNGTTPVLLHNTYRRMYRSVILTAGSFETNEGNILFEVVGTSDVALHIDASDGQTQTTIYTIPKGKGGYFIKGYVGIADDDKNGEVAEFQWQARGNNGVTGAWAVKGEMGVNNIGSSNWQYEYGVPAGMLPEKTDIRIRVIDATTTLGVVGGYDLVLVDI